MLEAKPNLFFLRDTVRNPDYYHTSWPQPRCVSPMAATTPGANASASNEDMRHVLVIVELIVVLGMIRGPSVDKMAIAFAAARALIVSVSGFGLLIVSHAW